MRKIDREVGLCYDRSTMAVRFIIGRAGSGKTHHCLEALREQLAVDPLDGPRLVLLVPEQASLQMERAILDPPGRSGGSPSGHAAHRAEVLSFQRLAFRVLDWVGGPNRQALSESARTMVVRHLVARRAEELRYYRRVARSGASTGRLGGFIERLSATITELIQEAVEPDQLAALAAQQDQPEDQDRAGDSVQRAKLHDLHLIYQAYLDYLGTDRLDPAHHLQVARAGLPNCQWLCGARLWVDGFASLSGQETLTLIELARMCQSVDITAMIDPSLGESPSTSNGTARPVGRLFSTTCRTYQELRDRFSRAGLEVQEPLLLEQDPPPRFGASLPLARLERSLFMSTEAEDLDLGQYPGHVELVGLPSLRIEADYAVSRVCRWLQESERGYRYRDIAIIVRDLEPYHDLLSEALRARGIPFFIDRRRPIAHHPIVELLRALAAIATGELPIAQVRLALKTGLFPISVEEADELENYLLAKGISGFDAWQGDDWSGGFRQSLVDAEQELNTHERAALSGINKTRRTFLRSVDLWLTTASAGKRYTGADWSAALVGVLERLEVGRSLRGWADDAELDGDLDQAEEHRQVWRDTMSFLDDLAFAFAEIELGIEELSDVLESGLSSLSLGLVPPMVDQVLVGSIERSRHPDIKAAIVLGFNDGVFPQQPAEDSILNDDDRTMLCDSGVGVRPASRLRARDEALLCYVALTRASENLVVTYSTADGDGKQLRPSRYVDALTEACPGLSSVLVGDPIRQRRMWDILSERDLTGRLAMEFRTRPAMENDDGTLRGQWNELYSSVRSDLSRNPIARRGLGSLDEKRLAVLSPVWVEQLYRGPLRTSVSELETYSACPFQHFARYTLRLREREEAILAPVDVGQIHHAILEDFVKNISSNKTELPGLSDGELFDGLNQSCARIAARLPSLEALSDPRNAYLLRRSASQLARIIQTQRKLSQSGGSRPRAAELPFGFQERGGLPAFELSTPAGRRVLLRGYIDRVDLVELGDELLGIVIDYKRTRQKSLNLAEVYHGLSLQLLAYLLVLAEVGQTLTGRRILPLGAVYVSLASQYVSVDHPERIASRDAGLEGTYRPRGLLLAEGFEALDRSLESDWSEHYAVYRKKDGSMGHIDASDAADRGSFNAMLDHTRLKLGQSADGLLDGDVRVNPYRLGSFSPCSWCSMTSVCRFEMGISEVRFLESLKRSEVFRRLAERGSTASKEPRPS